MQSINIQNIPTICLSCEKTKDRLPRLNTLFGTLGIKPEIFMGEITNPYTIGIAKAHKYALEKYQSNDLFLVLEDDVNINTNFKQNLESLLAPNTFDALYLGTSMYGRLRNETHYNGVLAIGYGNFVKPINMLGMHAIIYNNKRYIEHTLELLDQYIANPVGGIDDAIAESMIDFDIYAYTTPLFYQNDGHSETATLHNIPIIFECRNYRY